MSIPEAEQRKLFARSGNRCAFPDCRRLLTADGAPPDRLVILGEMAHIVAERSMGPRGQAPLVLVDRNRAENLILLCNVHHQQVDSQVHTYTVQGLLAMKQAHERWVDKTLGMSDEAHPDRQAYVTEVVHSTLLAVERMPTYIYGAPCDYGERDVQGRLGRLRQGEMAPYIVRERMLFAFQQLSEPGSPFSTIVTGQPVERCRSEEWWADADHLGWFIQLLNRSLNKLTGRRRLWLDREHDRYFFPPRDPEIGYEVQYRPLNQRRATRAAVWQPKKRSTGEPRPYWFHRAVSLRFIHTGAKSWGLSIRPELRITTDGVNPPPAENIGGKVTRKKARTFNYNLLAEMQFWRDYLGDSQPRILMSFGSPGQSIVIPTTLMQGNVTWPGIPAEHAKPFNNVEYVDDLFSWAEFQSLEAEYQSDEDDWHGESEDD